MSSDRGTALKQQLYETVLALASEEGNIEERLARAYFGHMQRLDASSLSADVHDEYEDICAALKRMYPAPGKLDDVDQTEAVNLAMRIILLYDSLVN